MAEPTFHESMWVAIAAAAPVISVAYVFVLERAFKWKPERGHQTKYRKRYVASKGENRQSLVMIGGGSFGFLLPAVTLYIALSSLAEGKDQGQLKVWTAVLPLCMVLLMIFSLASLAIDRWFEAREDERAK